MLFFDEHGKEILRVDSVVRLFRINKVLEYIISKDYKKTPIYQRWVSKQLRMEDDPLPENK